MVPIRAYDGTKSKNKTLASLAYYLIDNMSGKKDVRDIVRKDFLMLSNVFDSYKEELEKSLSNGSLLDD